MKTVARVLSDERYVADDTRRQVLRIIAEVGYVPLALPNRSTSLIS